MLRSRRCARWPGEKRIISEYLNYLRFRQDDACKNVVRTLRAAPRFRTIIIQKSTVEPNLMIRRNRTRPGSSRCDVLLKPGWHRPDKH